MKILVITALFSVVVFSTACKKKPEAPVEPTTIDKVCTEQFGPYYDERKYVKFHRVSFSGYLATPKSAMISNTMFVDVHEKPNRAGTLVRASFRVGTGKNQVERLGKSYKESDLKIEANNGTMLGHGSKVQIVGDVSPGGVPGKWLDGCYVRVGSVEQAQ